MNNIFNRRLFFNFIEFCASIVDWKHELIHRFNCLKLTEFIHWIFIVLVDKLTILFRLIFTKEMGSFWAPWVLPNTTHLCLDSLGFLFNRFFFSAFITSLSCILCLILLVYNFYFFHLNLYLRELLRLSILFFSQVGLKQIRNLQNLFLFDAGIIDQGVFFSYWCFHPLISFTIVLWVHHFWFRSRSYLLLWGFACCQGVWFCMPFFTVALNWGYTVFSSSQTFLSKIEDGCDALSGVFVLCSAGTWIFPFNSKAGPQITLASFLNLSHILDFGLDIG